MKERRSLHSVSQHDRRKLLKGLGAAGIAAASGLILPQHVLAAMAGTPATDKPVYGGRIRVASTSVSTKDTLDPAKASLGTDYTRIYTLYSGLTQFNREMGADLALAESMESQDQKSWQI